MKKITSLVASVSALLLITSCSHEADFDSTAYVQQKKNEYAQNFVKRYGEIDPNQTWDFTSGAATLSTTRATSKNEAYMIYGLDFGVKGWEWKIFGWEWSNTVTKNTALYNTLKQNWQEGVSKTGQAAVLVAPGNPFVIYPVTAQGTFTHDFCIKIQGYEEATLYSKKWTDRSIPYCNGMAYGTQTQSLKQINMYGVYVDVPAGTRIEVYLKNVNGQQGAVGTSSGDAIIVDAAAVGNLRPEVPTGLQGYTTVKYIGIEDAKTGKRDDDYNDVVVAMLGYPNVPEETPITDNYTYTETTTLSKRYMVEDLGDLDDFDFNDIVIDVEENTTLTHTVTLTNGVITSDVVSGTTKEQKAILRHRGGIYPFSIKIGDYTSDEFPGVLSDDPNIELTIDNNVWNPETNNISLNVRDMNTGAVVTIPFGMKGQAPMMVAVEPTLKWMPERKAVPNSWFDPIPERLLNRPDAVENGELETPITELAE